MSLYDQKNACNFYDFTDHVKEFSEERRQQIITWLDNTAKKWVFQAEMGHETNCLHYQGRLSLIEKKRGLNINNPLKLRFRLTSTNAITGTRAKQFSYVMKEDTRVDGPWTDKDNSDLVKYIPRQYRNIELRPWQKLLLEKAEAFNDRHINLIYDATGNKGKSVVAHFSRLHLKGLVIPCVNDQERLVATCCNICMSKKLRSPNPLFIDMPRAMGKDRLYGLYSAVEQIKSGYLFDLRNKYKDWDIDSPNIWVFSNKLPEGGILSADRWKIWYITDDMEELLPYTCDEFLD